jgi:sugar lactone lactonase YvrE
MNTIGPFKSFILLLFFSLSALSLAAADSLKFREVIQGEKRFTIEARAALTADDASQLNAGTTFEMTVGDFHFASALGADPKYSTKKKSVVLRDGGTRVRVSWTRDLLRVSVRGAAAGGQPSALVHAGNQVCAVIRLGSLNEPFRGSVVSRSAGRDPKARTVNSGTASPGECSPVLVTANVFVDVQAGSARITPLKSLGSGAGTKAVFTGSTISFNTSTLLDQPGELGRKVLRVSLENHTGETIGRSEGGAVTGLKVLFSSISNVTGFSNQAQRTVVSTVAGTGAPGTNDGPVGSATFNGAGGIAVAQTGEIYVADYNTHRIRVISSGYVSTLAGSGAIGGTDGAGVAATFSGPSGIAVNPVDGALIVAEFDGGRIRRVTPSGEVTTVATSFFSPIGVVVDSAGTIYVAESGAHRIRKIELSWRADPRIAANYTVSILAGSGASGSADGVGAGATFNFPAGIAMDEAGILYVTDRSNNKVRRVTSHGEVVTIAGTGVGNSVDGPGDLAMFSLPSGIAVVNGSLLVSELSGRKIRQVTLRADGAAAPANPRSWDVATLAGTGGVGSINGPGNVATFVTPYLLSAADSGTVYITDFSANFIRRLVPANGSFPVGVPNGSAPAEPVRLANPDGFVPVPPAVAAESQPYIQYPVALAAEEESPAKDWAFFVPSGVGAFEFNVTVEANTVYPAPLESATNAGSSNVIVRTYAGRALSGYIDGLASEARFNNASGIAVDKDANVYVADQGNHTIRRISANGVVITVAGGIGPGAADGPGNVARFNAPAGVAVSADGRTLYVADTGNNTIRSVRLGLSDSLLPGDCVVSTIAGASGGPAYVDNTRGDLARFSAPQGIAVNEAGGICMSEISGNRIRRLHFIGGDPGSATNWRVSLVAGNTTSPNGLSGTTDANGSFARFNNPGHLAMDLSGNIYVADINNHRVRKINPENDVTTLAGSTFGYLDATGTNALFIQPAGVAVDGSGYLYVSEANHRIRRISPSGVVTTVAGTGSSFPGDIDGPGHLATFYFPQGMALDRSGNLFVASGGTYLFPGGGGSTSPGLRVRVLQRVFSRGTP